MLAERNNQPEVARQALKDLVGLIDPVPMDFIRYRPQLLMLNGLAHYGPVSYTHLDVYKRQALNSFCIYSFQRLYSKR